MAEPAVVEPTQQQLQLARLKKIKNDLDASTSDKTILKKLKRLIKFQHEILILAIHESGIGRSIKKLSKKSQNGDIKSCCLEIESSWLAMTRKYNEELKSMKQNEIKTKEKKPKKTKSKKSSIVTQETSIQNENSKSSTKKFKIENESTVIVPIKKEIKAEYTFAELEPTKVKHKKSKKRKREVESNCEKGIQIKLENENETLKNFSNKKKKKHNDTSFDFFNTEQTSNNSHAFPEPTESHETNLDLPEIDIPRPTFETNFEEDNNLPNEINANNSVKYEQGLGYNPNTKVQKNSNLLDSVFDDSIPTSSIFENGIEACSFDTGYTSLDSSANKPNLINFKEEQPTQKVPTVTDLSQFTKSKRGRDNMMTKKEIIVMLPLTEICKKAIKKNPEGCLLRAKLPYNNELFRLEQHVIPNIPSHISKELLLKLENTHPQIQKYTSNFWKRFCYKDHKKGVESRQENESFKELYQRLDLEIENRRKKYTLKKLRTVNQNSILGEGKDTMQIEGSSIRPARIGKFAYTSGSDYVPQSNKLSRRTVNSINNSRQNTVLECGEVSNKFLSAKDTAGQTGSSTSRSPKEKKSVVTDGKGYMKSGPSRITMASKAKLRAKGGLFKDAQRAFKGSIYQLHKGK